MLWWCQVSDDVLHSGNCGERCCAITFFPEALSDTRVDEVLEIFGEPCLLRGVRFDDPELSAHLDALVKIPPVQVMWIRIRGHVSARSGGSDGKRDVCG